MIFLIHSDIDKKNIETLSFVKVKLASRRLKQNIDKMILKIDSLENSVGKKIFPKFPKSKDLMIFLIRSDKKYRNIVIFRKSETSFSPGEKIKNIDKMISKNKLDEKWNKFN